MFLGSIPTIFKRILNASVFRSGYDNTNITHTTIKICGEMSSEFKQHTGQDNRTDIT